VVTNLGIKVVGRLDPAEGRAAGEVRLSCPGPAARARANDRHRPGNMFVKTSPDKLPIPTGPCSSRYMPGPAGSTEAGGDAPLPRCVADQAVEPFGRGRRPGAPEHLTDDDIRF